ncbi:MAG TPA: lipid-binding SYLF domain-containing protein [Magnetospirillaceae bacterium]|jgi:lipid-binding SYLF domain-containing protein
MRNRILALLALLTAAFVLPQQAAHAQAGIDQQQTINKALGTVERLRTQQNFKADFNADLARARGVLVVPDLYKAGFILGGQFGNGALLVRQQNGTFSYPAFYTLSGGSIGLQIGAEDVSIVFLVMTENGLNALMQNKFKIGAEAQAALAVVGGGVEGNTTSNGGVDIKAYALGAIGLYGSLSLEGAVIAPRDTWNEAYYGKPVAAHDVAFSNAAQNPEADRLRDFLAH